MVVRRGHKRAIIAIDHKILRIIFFVVKRPEHYRDPPLTVKRFPFNVILICIRNDINNPIPSGDAFDPLGIVFEIA